MAGLAFVAFDRRGVVGNVGAMFTTGAATQTEATSGAQQQFSSEIKSRSLSRLASTASACAANSSKCARASQTGTTTGISVPTLKVITICIHVIR